MKYVYYHQKYDDGIYSRDAVDKTNAEALEDARIHAWHKTFNAAITGLITVADNGDAIEYATKVANKVHGEL